MATAQQSGDSNGASFAAIECSLINLTRSSRRSRGHESKTCRQPTSERMGEERAKLAGDEFEPV